MVLHCTSPQVFARQRVRKTEAIVGLALEPKRHTLKSYRLLAVSVLLCPEIVGTTW